MISTYYLFIVLGFLAVVLLLEGLYLTWNAYSGPQARNIARRLVSLSAGQGGDDAIRNLLKHRSLSKIGWMDRLLLRVPRIHLLDRLLVQSGLPYTVAGVVTVTLLAYCGAVLLFLFANLGLQLALIGSVPVGAAPFLLILNQRQKRIDKIDAQLPEAIDLIGRALRAGHAFQGAVQMVANEGAEPVASEFRITFDEINFGVPLQDALLNLATRVPSTDLRYFVIAVLIHRDTGGNLAELLDNISRLMRERIKLKGSIQVLAAEGKLSAWILGVMPFALAALLNIVNPGFMKILFTDPQGRQVLATSLVLMAFGVIWLWRLTKIRV